MKARIKALKKDNKVTEMEEILLELLNSIAMSLAKIR